MLASPFASLVVGIFSPNIAQAVTVFSLQAANGLQGSPATLAVNIANAPASGGFNVHIVLPAGISVSGVTPGALLTTAGGFNLAYDINGQNLKVVGYSGATTFIGTGALLSLQLQVQPTAPPGYYPTGFALSNANVLVNSRHALSNADGSQSLTHTVVGQNFLVYSNTSDFDGDTLTDRWELANTLSPLDGAGPNGGSGDPDIDGVSNRDEYRTGTNPANNLSKPEGAGGVTYVLFRDKFDDSEYRDRWFVGAPDPGSVFTLFESGTLLDEKLLQPVSGCLRADLRSTATVDAANHVYRAVVTLENHGKTLVGLMQNNDTGNRIELQFDTTGTPALKLRSVQNGAATETLAGTPVSYTNQTVEIRMVSKPVQTGSGKDYFVFVNKVLQFIVTNTTITGTALRPFLAAESCVPDGGYLLSHFDLVEMLRDRDADGLGDGYEDPNFNGTVDSGETNPLLADVDGDGQLDGFDNCSLVSNATQLDANGDRYGNLCDPDLNNSGLVTTADFGILRSVLNQSAVSSPTAAAADLNGSGTVTTADFAILRSRLNAPPGPSGLTP